MRTLRNIAGRFLPNVDTNTMTYERISSAEDDAQFAEFCENCTVLDLVSRLRLYRWFFCIGQLTRYSCPTCPLCSLVWDSVRLHWGPENPLVPHDKEPTLYLFWNTKTLSLHITQRPPGVSGPGLDISCFEKAVFRISYLDHSYQPLPTSTSTGELGSRNTIRSRLEIGRLQRILQLCTNHDLCSNQYLEKEVFRPSFRLIDVYEARLVDKTSPCEYFALSYVWGGSQKTRLQTTKRNLVSLQQPSALSRGNRNHREQLSLTISDTIDLCRSLGQRYLWVDCLCIVQDDLEEKMRLIHGMGQVYENASLTIFAVSGSNADHGLAGITARKDLPRERVCSIDTKTDTLTLSLRRLSLRVQIEKSHWNTRGWTYQEQALSGRRLYLTEEEAFFVCRESHWREGYHEGDDMLQPLGPEISRTHSYNSDEHFVRVPDRKDSKSSNWVSFISSVFIYTKKDLSYPEDALYAFSGIYNRFASIDPADPGIIATQGNLLSSFPFCLFWYGVHDGTTKPGRRSGIHDIKLSSWSWASWIGPIDFVSLDRPQENPQLHGKTAFETRNSGICWNLRVHDNVLHCFVDDWFITSRQQNPIIRFNSPNSLSQPDRERPIEQLNTVDQLLSIFPDRPPLYERYTEVGTLNFVAPCFAYPSGITKNITASEPRQQHLGFPGTKTICCVIQFDSADEEFQDFALFYYDGSYQALCVKTVDGVSTRVGLAVMCSELEAWKNFIQSGLLTIEWKQIELQ
jgi:hypothetical protein